MQEHKKILGSGCCYSSSSASHTTMLIISNDEMKDIIKVVKSLEDSGLLLKGVSETVRNEAEEKKGGFLSMLLGTLSASLLGNVLTSKGVIAKSVSEETKLKKQGWVINRASEGVIRAGYVNKSKMDF